MDVQPRYDPLEPSSLFPDGRSARPIETGTVPMTGDLSPNSPILTGLDQNGQPYQGFPEPVTQDMVKLGQERFNIYCVPCHGPSGQGDGKVIAFGFPKPANLLGDSVKSLTNGEIFSVIENGKGKMFSYGYRIKPQERWAVIAYIRAMELKNGPVNPSDLTPDQLNQLGK
jgi:mono/diheme cytochrome c family protein